jgi:hypothetical protein
MSADLHPEHDNLNTSQEQFCWSLQNLSSLHKMGWRSAEKVLPFSRNASSMYVASLVCMESVHMQRIYKAFHTYVPTSTMEFWSRVAR